MVDDAENSTKTALEQPSTTALAQAGMLTRLQLSRELGLDPQTLRLWERRGMPSIMEGKTVLYYVPNIIKWLLRGKRRGRGR